MTTKEKAGSLYSFFLHVFLHINNYYCSVSKKINSYFFPVKTLGRNITSSFQK